MTEIRAFSPADRNAGPAAAAPPAETPAAASRRAWAIAAAIAASAIIAIFLFMHAVPQWRNFEIYRHYYIATLVALGLTPSALAVLVLVRGLGAVEALFKARGNSEHDQAIVRIFMGLVILIYLTVHGFAAGFARTVIIGPVLIAGVSFCVAYLILLHVAIRPGASPVRRVLANIVDIGGCSLFLHYGDHVSAPFYVVYLWVTLGCGFRYGPAYLFGSAAISLVTFAMVLATTEFWVQHDALAYGLLVALLLLPAYVAKLIRMLHKAKAAAEAASHAKSRFLATISHELRTPLNTIIGIGGLLKASQLDNEQRSMVRSVRSAARTLLSQINTILDFSKIEAGKISAKRDPFDLASIVAEVDSMFRIHAQGKGLAFSVHMTAGTPAGLVGDADHIRNVVVNLVGNALKFTEAGRVWVVFDLVQGDSAHPRLSVRVGDTGIGIPQEAFAKIFESFRQGDELINRRFGGTGLGLSIVKQLVQIMRGTVDLDSAVGRGSVFTVTVPIGVSAAATRRHVLSPGERVFVATRDAQLSATLEKIVVRCGGRVIAIDEAGKFGPSVRLAVGTSARPIVLADPASFGLSPREFSGLARETLPSLTPIMIRTAPDDEPSGPPDDSDLDYFATVPRTKCETAMPALLYAADLMAFGVGGQRPDAQSGAPKRSLHVLLAEDNAVNRRILARILEIGGHRVTAVEDGEAALAALDREAFDIAVLDVNMPRLSGIEVTKLHRFAHLDGPRLPIVALTADATPEGRQRAVEAGMDAVALKPIEADELVHLIETHARPGPSVSPPAAKPAAETAVASNGKMSLHPKHRGGLPPIVDPSAIEALRCLSGPEGFFEDLVEEFIRDTSDIVRRCAAAVPAGDAKAVRDEAHALRSAAAHFGARRLHQLCVGVADLRREDVAEKGPPFVASLRREYELVVQELRRNLEQRPQEQAK